MKSVMLSVRPEWCEKIASGEKTLEVRKSRPKLEVPFKVYIYCTRSGNDKNPNMNLWKPDETGFIHLLNGKVIGEFVCDNIRCFDVPYPAFQGKLDPKILEQSCCTYYMLHRYAYHDNLYGWNISDLKIYDKPRKLGEFYSGSSRLSFNEKTEDGFPWMWSGMKRPPQSWCYVEGEK